MGRRGIVTAPSEQSPSATRVKALLVTGTDTNVGKTHVTCLIAKQLVACGIRVGAYKPVCSGATQRTLTSDGATDTQWDDIERLRSAVGGDWPTDIICPQRFLAPVAPPVAAAMEGTRVDFQRMMEGAYRISGVDVLLIEGAGGWLSPVTESAAVADLAREWNVPILIVARAGLGTINHTLLTIESIRARGLKVAGVVLNESVLAGDDVSSRTNRSEIQKRTTVPVFGIVPYGNDLELLRDGDRVTIRWDELAGPFGPEAIKDGVD